MDKSESHVYSMDERKPKRVIINACSLYESKSKSVYISVNTSEVKYVKNKKKDEKPSVMDNSVINATRYFKLFECGKKFLNKIDTTCE